MARGRVEEKAGISEHEKEKPRKELAREKIIDDSANSIVSQHGYLSKWGLSPDLFFSPLCSPIKYTNSFLNKQINETSKLLFLDFKKS